MIFATGADGNSLFRLRHWENVIGKNMSRLIFVANTVIAQQSQGLTTRIMLIG